MGHTEDKLNAIRARIDAATPGAWVVGGTDMSGNRFVGQKYCSCCPENPSGSGDLVATAGEFDAVFIANAKSDLLFLLAENEELRKEIGKV